MVTALCALWLVVGTSSGRPTEAALHRAVEGAGPSLVEVWGPHRNGPGIVVGAGGEVLTTPDFVGLETATVKLREGPVKGRVVTVNARSRIAVVLLPAAARAPSAIVSAAPLEVGDYLVAVQRSRSGAVRPTVGRVLASGRAPGPFIPTTLALPPGTPVMDLQGRVMGLVVARTRLGSNVVPMSAVRLELAQARHD